MACHSVFQMVVQMVEQMAYTTRMVEMRVGQIETQMAQTTQMALMTVDQMAEMLARSRVDQMAM